MSFTFGRAGLATNAGGDGLVVPGHYPAARDGDEVTIEVDLTADTVAKQTALRDQFLGYDLNTDEPVLPVTSSDDPTLDGFYRVQGVSVVDTVGTHFAGGIGSHATLELLKVPGWQAPLFEVLCSGADRSSAVASPTELSWVAIPNLRVWWAESHPAGETTIDTANNDTVLHLADLTYSNAIYFSPAADEAYTASARIESTADAGSTWQTVVGRQTTTGPTAWRISNDLVRVTAGSTAGQFTVELWDDAGSAWRSKGYEVLQQGTYESTGDPLTFTVLRNGPEAVSVRVYYGSVGTAVHSCDFTLRRGQTWLEGVVGNPRGAQNLGVGRSSTEAGTDMTQGLIATSDDAAGHKYRILSPKAVTTENTEGQIVSSSSTTSFPFAISSDMFDGTIAALGRYFAAMRHRQRIVAR